MARFQTANDIINRVLVETGLSPVPDAYASADPAVVQLQYLINTAGQELIEEHPWAILTRSEQIITQLGDSGSYPLPDDYAYMIDQTGWERNQNVPLFGPLSAQEWTYLIGRDLVSYTIYASFRLFDNTFNLFPQPPAAGMDVNYEYISRNWVKAGDQADTFRDNVQVASDVALYPPILISRLLKLRFMQARGFDTTLSNSEYLNALQTWKGKDNSAPILNAGDGGWQYPYLETYRNTPDTGYGL